MLTRFVLICSFALLSLLVSADNTPKTLALDHTVQQVAVGPYAYILEDAEGLYTPQQIIDLNDSNFDALNEESLNKGFTNSTYWLKFTIKDQTLDNLTQTWKLETTYPLLDYIDIYIVDEQDQVKHIQMGDTYPFDQRDVDHRNFITTLALNDAETQKIFVRVNTSSSMQIPMFIWHSDYFFEARSGEQYGLGLYYGMMLVMFFYNFFLWFSIRDSNYLWYIGYIGAFALLQATTSGLGYQYIWPNSPWIESIAPPVTIALVGIFGIAFTRRFLHTQQYHVVADHLLRSVLYLSMVVLALSFIADTSTVMSLAKIVVVLFLLFILYASIAMLIRGHRQARFFLAAWVSLILGGLFTIGMMLGVFPNTLLMTHASKVGSVLEIILLSFALADRIKVIEGEKKIIEQRAQQELERSNKKLQENNRLKDEFLATISHEFRTPLNGIMGSLELAEQEIQSEIQQHLDTAKGSANEMLKLVDGVLNYTELQSGQFILNSRSIDLDNFVQALSSEFHQRCKEKSIVFHYHPSERNPHTVLADHKRLKQAIIPILDNAVKFTDEGHVSLSIEVKYLKDQYFLQVQVEDTGIGIAEKQQATIMDAFTQGDGSFSRQFGGLGIGLSLVKALCSQLGGSITVSSEESIGTTVELYFPIEVPHATGTPQQEEPVYQDIRIRENARILIVEDNHINQVVLKTMLQRLNLETITADHGGKALNVMEQSLATGESIDLILMDCQMPVMDGFETTRHIRNSHADYASIPIVAVTANALSGDKERCLQCGMNDYLSKPFQLEDIRRKLQLWLAQPSNNLAATTSVTNS